MPSETKTTRRTSAHPIKLATPASKSDAQTRQTVRLYLGEQQYTKALKLMSEETQQSVIERFSEEFMLAINGSIDQAGSFMQNGQYSEAGMLLKTVMDNYPTDPVLQEKTTKTPEHIANDIYKCTEKMMASGLMAYRSGELSTAIDIWEQVLSIDPEHLAAQDSIQTTRIQLSRLKDLHSKD